MKRVFLFKTLLLCIFILSQFSPQNSLLVAQKKNPVLTVLPGKTVSQQLVLKGRKTEMVNFTVNTPGKIEVKAEWTGSANVLIFILYKPGYVQAVRKEGRSPIVVEYNVPDGMAAPGNQWRVSLANFSSKTSAIGSICISQEGLPEPEKPVILKDKTTIKDYKLMEETEKDLNNMDSETEVVESKPGKDTIEKLENPDLIWILYCTIKRHLAGYPGGKSDMEEYFDNAIKKNSLSNEFLGSLADKIKLNEEKLIPKLKDEQLKDLSLKQPLTREMMITYDMRLAANNTREQKPMAKEEKACSECLEIYNKEVGKDWAKDPDFEIWMIECVGKNVRQQRQQFTTMFENFDQKANQLFTILSTVLKSIKEMKSSIKRNVN